MRYLSEKLPQETQEFSITIDREMVPSIRPHPVICIYVINGTAKEGKRATEEWPLRVTSGRHHDRELIKFRQDHKVSKGLEV